MSTLHTTEIDGVWCAWVDTGRPTLRASLRFRFGMADEPLPESGWQHILEHLVLTGREQGTLQVNGSVSLLETSFDLHGPADQVVGALAGITTWLSEPDLSGLDHERKVLAAEARTRGGGPVHRALAWRYGAHGPGVAAYEQPGLVRATPETLTERAHRAFTRSNAALVLDGPPPPGLSLSLSSGPLIAPAAASPVYTGPGSYNDGPLVLTGEVQRSVAATLATEVLRLSVEGVLRHDIGHSYDIASVYEPVDGDRALLGVMADVVDESPRTASDRLLEVMDDLLVNGPADELHQQVVARRVQELRDPYAAIGIAYYAASLHFAGQHEKDLEACVDEIEVVSPHDVRTVLIEAGGNVLLGAPVPVGRRLPVLIDPLQGPGAPATGVRFRAVNWPADDSLMVLATNLVEVHGEGVAQRAPLPALAAYLKAADGRRSLIRRDGFAVHIEPDAWTHGHRAVETLDKLVAPGLHLDVEAAPGRNLKRINGAGRWMGGLQRWLGSATADQSRPMFALSVASLIIAGMVGTLVVLFAFGLEDTPVVSFASLPMIFVLVLLFNARAESRKTRAEQEADRSLDHD